MPTPPPPGDEMYGRNQARAAELQNLLRNTPPEQQAAALEARSARLSGTPEAPGGYREPTEISESGAWTTGLPRATGVLNRALGALPAGISSGYEGQIALGQDITRSKEREAGMAGEAGIRMAEREAGVRQEHAARERERLGEFQRQMPTLPEFIPTQETATDMATLFSMLAVVGTALGGKGSQGAIGAMQSMTGMLNGWKQGRADLYQRERQKFETDFRRIQDQRKAIEDAYRRYSDLAKTDLEGAMSGLRVDAARLQAPILLEVARRGNPEQALQIMGQVTQAATTLEGKRMEIAAQVTQAATTLEGKRMEIAAQTARHNQTLDNQAPQAVKIGDQWVYAQRRGNTFVPMQMNGALIPAPPPPGSPEYKESELRAREDYDRRNIRGQERFLEQQGLTSPEIRNLGAREVPAVASKIEAAELTFRLAEEIRLNPSSAGIVGRILGRLDALDPSRYGNETDPGLVSQALGLFIDREPVQGSPDEVTKARSIAKLAVDVINARALAASGGSRMLVSEFNAQKGVIGLQGMSPESAVPVYERLARDDLAGVQRYGVQPDRIAALQNIVRSHAVDYVSRAGRSSSVGALSSPAPAANSEIPTFATQAEADAAMTARNAPAGTRIRIGNQTGLWSPR